MRGTRVTLRRARISDSAAIAAVMRTSVRFLAAGSVSPRQLAAWSSLPPIYHAWAMTAGGEEYVVAVTGGRVVGYAARRGREITALFVRPSHARRGLGARLLAGVERRVAASGARSAFVRAAPGAVPFYESMGYRGRRTVRVPLPGGLHLRSRRLARRLPPTWATGSTRAGAYSRPHGLRNGQRRHSSRSSSRGNASSRATFRPGSWSAAFIAPIESRIAAVQAESAASSAATETRSPAGRPFPTR